jgi:hypothetical protein
LNGHDLTADDNRGVDLLQRHLDQAEHADARTGHLALNPQTGVARKDRHHEDENKETDQTDDNLHFGAYCCDHGLAEIS